MAQPTSFELGHAKQLVVRVNARRGKQGKLTQRNELDQAAWQMVLELPKYSYDPAEIYQRGMTPVERVQKVGFPMNVRPIEKCAHKSGFSSKDSVLAKVVDSWLKDTTFASAALGRAYVWCGAAYRNNCYVLLVAG